MNISKKCLDINTLDESKIQQLKNSIFQCIDQHQFQLQNYFHKERLTNFQNSKCKLSQSIVQVFNKYQGSLVQIINLGHLTISICEILLEFIQKTKQSETFLLQNYQQNESQMHQYIRIKQEENKELLQRVQHSNHILETQNQKIKQLSNLLQIQRHSKHQVLAHIQQKIQIDLLKQNQNAQNLQIQNKQLRLNLDKLNSQIKQKNRQIQLLLKKNQQITMEIQQIKNIHKHQTAKNNELHPLTEINQYDIQKNKFNSPISKSFISQSKAQLSEFKMMCSPKYLKNLFNNQHNKQNNPTENIVVYSHFNSPKTIKNQRKIDYAFKNVAVNTDDLIMKTKTTQFDGFKKPNIKNCDKNTKIQIKELKQNQFINNIKVEKNLNQEKSMVKTLVRYMSDKVIYQRIKRKH